MSGRAPSAYALGEALKALREAHQRLMELDDTIADDDRLLMDSLEGEAVGDPFGVIDRFVRASKLDTAFAKGCREEAATLTARAVRLETRAKARRQTVLDVMHILGRPTLERPTYTATAMDGQPGVVITKDIEDVPQAFIRTTKAVDKEAVGKALKNGETLDFAELHNAQPYIVIRS